MKANDLSELQFIIDKVSFSYEQSDTKSLNNISFCIKRGEFIGIIGHTGSGKTTLVQHLNGLLKATEGKIYYNGNDIYDKNFDMRILRGDVGLVFQYPEHQLFEETVYKDVYFGPSRQNISIVEAQKRSYEALKLVGISDSYLDTSPFDLSGGQMRKVAMAGVIAMNPETLILDEPTAGLDPRTKKEMLDMIKGLHQQTNMTIIIVSHSMEDMADYVDRIIVMNDGKVYADDTPAKVFLNNKELEKIGLSVPQVTSACDGLKNAGCPLVGLPITVEQAKDVIEDFLTKRGRNI